MAQSIQDAVYDATMTFLRERKSLQREGPAELSLATLAFQSSLLDSLGFVELITAIETGTGLEIDFLMVDPEQIETIGDLIEQLTLAAKVQAA